jgi:hypothetical protein
MKKEIRAEDKNNLIQIDLISERNKLHTHYPNSEFSFSNPPGADTAGCSAATNFVNCSCDNVT